MFYLEKEFNIACSHKLHNENINIAMNKDLFGKCNSYHGHNYKIILKFKSEKLDFTTGMIMNFYDIKKVFKTYIDDVFDHKCLNDCAEFKDIIPTAENMCKVFFDILREPLQNLYSIKIYETDGACAGYVKD